MYLAGWVCARGGRPLLPPIDRRGRGRVTAGTGVVGKHGSCRERDFTSETASVSPRLSARRPCQEFPCRRQCVLSCMCTRKRPHVHSWFDSSATSRPGSRSLLTRIRVVSQDRSVNRERERGRERGLKEVARSMSVEGARDCGMTKSVGGVWVSTHVNAGVIAGFQYPLA